MKNALVVLVLAMALPLRSFGAGLTVSSINGLGTNMGVIGTFSITNGSYINLYFANGTFLRTNTSSPFDWEYHTNGQVTFGTNNVTKVSIKQNGDITLPQVNGGTLTAQTGNFSQAIFGAGGAFWLSAGGDLTLGGKLLLPSGLPPDTNNAASVSNVVALIGNGSQPFYNVINVKNSPYNAKGDGVADDWAAIQAAITTACLATNGPVGVYIPEGTYRITNTLALTTQTNASIAVTGNTSISELFGDGGRRTVLQFTVTNANGLEFRVVTNDPRHLSNFALHDLALMGPALGGNTNVSGSGFFFGYDANLFYGGDTPGWHDSAYNCLIQGWKVGLSITNSVFFTIRNCNFFSNIVHSVHLAHADTTRLENNNLGFPVVANADDSALCVDRDKSGAAGQGVINIGGECGNSACVIRLNGGIFAQVGGNFERNNVIICASNFCQSSIKGCQISLCTNAPFVFINGGGTGFWADTCAISDTSGTLFDQRHGSDTGINYPIHHALNSSSTNGLFDGVVQNYPPVFFQTPRWTQGYQLAECVNFNCNVLNPLSTSPSPFFSSDGLGINNTTGQIWLPLPSGLGNNAGDFNREDVRFTVLIQGGTGATNAFLTLNTLANRKNPAIGDTTDESPSFTISGITNGMCKVYSWTNHWSATSDANMRYERLQFVTTNQIYLIGLNAETIDY